MAGVEMSSPAYSATHFYGCRISITFCVCTIDMQQVGPEEIVEFDDPQKSIGNSR